MINIKTKIQKSLDKLHTPTSIKSSGGYDRGGETSESTQLIFPQDLGTNTKEYNGHCVLFEPNIINGHKSAYSKSLVQSSNTISGVYGNEVAMQNAKINGGSMRSTIANKGYGGAYTKTNERILLPMPQSVATTYGADWQSTSLGAVGRIKDFITSAGDLDFGIMAEQSLDSLSNTLTGALQAITGFNVKDAMEISQGQMENPYTEVMFKGIGNRSLPFQYKLNPRNLEEAKIIRAIIHRFKYHMMPEFKYNTGNNSYILYPSTFDISFLNIHEQTGNVWLHKMSTCALTNLSVNGTPNGDYTINKGGNPTSVTIDLAFTEMTILTKANFPSPEDSF